MFFNDWTLRFKNRNHESSLVVQWLRFHAPIVRDMSSVLGRELRSWCCRVWPKPPKTKPEKKSSSAYHLSGRQLCTLARVIPFASIIVFRFKDNHITLLCWDLPPFIFGCFRMMSSCVRLCSIPSAMSLFPYLHQISPWYSAFQAY